MKYRKLARERRKKVNNAIISIMSKKTPMNFMTGMQRASKAKHTLKILANRLAGLSHALFLSRIDRYMTINRQNRKNEKWITAYGIRNSLGRSSVRDRSSLPSSVLLELLSLDEFLPSSGVILK